MRIASVNVEKIKDLSSLLVGMPECATHSRLFNPEPEGRHGELHWLYVLDAHEVVFGCRAGLIAALRKMDKAGAKAILLIVTCVPELIGEDIQAIVNEVQPELSARVTFVLLGQFKNISYPPGSWKMMAALGTLMAAKTTESSRVNVLGRAPAEEHIPLPSLLPALTRRGLELRYLAPGSSLQAFQSAPDAALNLVVSPFMQPLAARMEREFGVPAIALHTLYAVESIDKAYTALAARFGLAWGDTFAEERQQALAWQKAAQERLKGLRYVFCPRIDIPLPLAVYLTGLGMEPLLLHLEEYYPEDRDYARELTAMGHNPWVCRMVNAQADLPVLEKLAPDLNFGYLPATHKTIPCVPDLFDFYGQVGYGRTSHLLKRIVSILDKMNAAKKGGPAHGSASL
ncbi:nitrogenase component 1 [Sporomusa termitida]|uniref:Light-independent protochlorophyllide reductase subunit N n=1 Tax=Sporomusa termitida TaxID=2377 RepID=A0A517DZ95_9FIRM|nr:nitrogenase component 1 [Sporomusa termitida]QDR82684.1 Light-independent protochlorophyllide reductase subunit N [Sporomusa termitida]